MRYRPRQTLEAFLGVHIPELVSVSVILEDPHTFGLVVPMPHRNGTDEK